MDAKSYRGSNINSDHCLLISSIKTLKELPSNERKNYGLQARKFFKKRLNELEVIQAYVKGINEHLSRLTGSEDVCQTWKNLKEIIIMTADEK